MTSHEREDDDSEQNRCPYCDSTEACVHLLLCVDTTFRSAEGGLLMAVFNDRWSEIEEGADDPEFDERESFQELLDEVDSLANVSAEYDFDGGPGRFSAYELFYAKTEAHAQEALKRFASS